MEGQTFQLGEQVLAENPKGVEIYAEFLLDEQESSVDFLGEDVDLKFWSDLGTRDSQVLEESGRSR